MGSPPQTYQELPGKLRDQLRQVLFNVTTTPPKFSTSLIDTDNHQKSVNTNRAWTFWMSRNLRGESNQMCPADLLRKLLWDIFEKKSQKTIFSVAELLQLRKLAFFVPNFREDNDMTALREKIDSIVQDARREYLSWQAKSDEARKQNLPLLDKTFKRVANQFKNVLDQAELDDKDLEWVIVRFGGSLEGHVHQCNKMLHDAREIARRAMEMKFFLAFPEGGLAPEVIVLRPADLGPHQLS